MTYIVNKTLSKSIEDDLEMWYKSFSCPWSRIYKDGQLTGYKGVLDNLDLHIEQVSENVLMVSLQGKVDKGYNPYKEYYTVSDETGYYFELEKNDD